MSANIENLNPYDCVKRMEEKNRFVDILLNLQIKYPTDSVEHESIKLAVGAIVFSMELQVECGKKMLTENQRERMNKIELIIQQEYKDNFPCENNIEDNDISLNDISKMIACLNELLEKSEKSTEDLLALKCALKDIEMAMSQEKRFSFFFDRVVKGNKRGQEPF
jgi:hypothetical protein